MTDPLSVNFGANVRSNLGPARPTTRVEALQVAVGHLGETHSVIESAFGQAGFFGKDGVPYPSPQLPFDAPTPKRPTRISALRDLWIGHWNPSDERFGGASDIDDPWLFPWGHPEAAARDGWWITTERQPGSILHASPGDLVVAQRQRPNDPDPSIPVDSDNMYVGLAAVLATTSWRDAATGRFESRACLVPLCHFNFPVPIRTAKRTKGRLADSAFSKLPATQDRKGMSRALSAVPRDVATELLSVCGVSPEVLAEPDLAVIAGRLATTSTGNKEYLDLRYDHLVRQAAKRKNELRAESAAKAWAKSEGYTFVSSDIHIGLAGYDLLFVDGNNDKLQIEVKGYSTHLLSEVHLQPSQETRARNAAAGVPPDWRLFALLRSGTARPDEVVRLPQEVVDLIESGGIAVNRR